MKGVIVAAGYGTRFLPVTKTVPKEMLPLVTRPAIDIIVEEFERSGIEEILIITSRRKKALEDYFDREIELESVFREQGAEQKLAAIEPRRARIFFYQAAGNERHGSCAAAGGRPRLLPGPESGGFC